MTLPEILDKTLAHEGGWVNHPNDPGAETYKGISRKHHSDWIGWPEIDNDKNSEGVPDKDALEANSYLQEMVRMFYTVEFWEPSQASGLPEGIQGEYFDMCVNFGRRGACRVLQSAANLYATPGEEIEVDGYIGPNTIRASQDTSIEALKACRLRRYVDLIDDNRSLNAFIRGWYRRAIS